VGNVKMNFNKIDPLITSRYVTYFSIKTLKSFKIEDEVMCDYVCI
jgi:hypothetical protein